MKEPTPDGPGPSAPCHDCGLPLADRRYRCPACSKKHNDARNLRKPLGKCRDCNHPVRPGTTKCEKCHAGFVGWRQRLKDEVFAAYGGYVCSCCGEKRRPFLTIDHVDQDGAAHRREVGEGTRFLSWVKKNHFPGNLRIRCYNCNSGAYRNGGVCPHEEERLARAPKRPRAVA